MNCKPTRRRSNLYSNICLYKVISFSPFNIIDGTNVNNIFNIDEVPMPP
jgi:hypothetical protein